MQARAFGSIACRQAPPCAFRKILRDLCGAPANHLLLAPGMEQMIGGNAQNITLARFAERGFEFSRAVHAVRRNKREGNLCRDRTRDHLARHLRFRRFDSLFQTAKLNEVPERSILGSPCRLSSSVFKLKFSDRHSCSENSVINAEVSGRTLRTDGEFSQSRCNQRTYGFRTVVLSNIGLSS